MYIGTGKSITAGEVAARLGLRHIDVGQVAKDNGLHEGWDEQYQCPILNEDKVSCGRHVGFMWASCGGGGVKLILSLYETQ